MKKILLVEDEKIMSDLLTKKLTQAGYDVKVRDDGNAGLEEMRKENYDLILLDIIMPRKGGLEVLEEMKSDDYLKNVPVIIISNSGQPVELSRAKELGANDFLVKTEFDPQEILEKVKKLFGE